MEENGSEFLPLRVVNVGKDGKRRFDEAGKQKLLEACLQSGVSVASMALKAGVNANQLWRWIKKYQAQKKNGKALAEIVEPAAPSFVAVQQIADASAAQLLPHSGTGSASPVSAQRETVRPSQRPPLPSRLIAQLPNGVSVELECAAQDAALVTAMIETLGRCHVPARR